MFQTPQEISDQYLADARSYLSCCPTLRVDRSRHESVMHTCLWIFDRSAKGKEEQIACIVRDAIIEDKPWRVNALYRGSPVTERRVATLLDAVGEMMRATKNTKA
jgi:hypothetical protein